MHLSLNVSVDSMGIVTMVISLGTVISSLLSDKLTHKFGTPIVTVASILLTAVGLFGFGLASRFWMLVVFAVPYGLGAGAIDAALNNYVALHYSSRHMSWLHCFWGAGAIISPFIMSYALNNGCWNDGYVTVGFIQLAIAVVLVSTLFVWKVNGNKQTDGATSIGLIQALKIKGVVYILVGFCAYCSLEATAMGWASTYMVETRGIDTSIGASYASLFYIGITAGRFISGFVTDKTGDRKMIITGTCVLAIGILLVAIDLSDIVFTVIGFVVIGLGCAPIYPSIIHSTPNNFGAQYSGAIIGIQMASAYVGSTFMPPLFGLLGKAIGFEILPAFLAVFAVIMIVMTELTFNITSRQKTLICNN